MLYKFIMFDIKNGVFRCYKKYIFAASLFVCIYVFFLSSFQSLYHDLFLNYQNPVTFGDYILYLFQGLKIYEKDQNAPFIFPALWILLFLVIAFITLYYPYNDLNETGRHMLILSQKRYFWWYAKCIWVAVSVAAYFILAYFIAWIFLLFTHGEMNLHVNFATLIICELPARYLRQLDVHAVSGWSVVGFMLVVPVIAVSICLFQMLLSLIFKPYIGFILISVYLFAATYFCHPLFIGNYAMILRSAAVIPGGMTLAAGLIYALGLSFLSVFGGALYFRRMDIF